MEVNAVTTPVMSALVIYAAANQAPTWTALVIGQCYDCNKPGHVKKNCLNETQAQTSYNRGPKREFSCYNCNKKGNLA